MSDCSYWMFDSFFSEALAMRSRIEEHFDDEISKGLSFDKRAIWNYWHINKLYTYLRADPHAIFPELYERFVKYLRIFAAREFGMVVTNAFLSMYVNGCGQELHNDVANGCLGFVFSLTKWKERHFEGGETLIMKFDEDLHTARMKGVAGQAFYYLVEPEFNRLVVFDDRMIHGVRRIQGTMDPVDSRIVIHGHFREPPQIAWIQGAMKANEIEAQWEQMKDEVSHRMHECGCEGFVTLETIVNHDGQPCTRLKHSQLLPAGDTSKNSSKWPDDILESLSEIRWPKSKGPTTLIYAISSDSLLSHWK